MKKNNVYSFEVTNWNEEIIGQFITEGKKWILIHDNTNDFILDGYRFIQKVNIMNIKRGKDEIFKEKIFKLKGFHYLNIDKDYNLNDTIPLLNQIMNDDIIIQYDAEDEEDIYVGKFVEINSDNFRIKSLTTRAEWSSNYLCKFDEISSFSIKNDYLNSLSLLLENIGDVHRLKIT